VKKQLALIVSLLALSAVGASAADMATPPTYTKAAPMPVAVGYDWSGPYLGASVGGRWSKSDWTSTCLDSCTPLYFTLRLPNDNPANFDSSTVRAGAYFGYNWQLSRNWIWGLEGDFAWGDSKSTHIGIPGAYTTFPGSFTTNDPTSVRETWDGSARLRLGYAIAPTLMLYGTGGAAFQRVELNTTCFATSDWCVANRNETYSTVKAGWTVGAGLEGVISGNWIGRLEYRYADYGKINHDFFPGTIDDIVMNESLRTHTVSVGIAYKFGGPVVAKY
jgi:outer membrane immunogenic protein